VSGSNLPSSAPSCSNPWHEGASLGSQFFPACPSCETRVWAPQELERWRDANYRASPSSDTGANQ
jgi:hypothetical protein